MNLLGVAGSVLSAVGSFIETCVTKLGPVICTTANRLIAIIEKLDPNINWLQLACNLIKSVGELFGLIRQEDQIDELGAKAMQEDSLKRDEFKSEQEYIEYLKNEVELDKEKFAQALPVEKLSYATIGVSIVSKSIEEKTGVQVPPEFLLTATQTKMSLDEIGAYINKFKEKGFETLGVISDYLKGKDMNGKENIISSVIMEGLREVNPSMNEEQIQDKLVDMIVVSKEDK